jgi:hypothetical protein
MSHFDSLADREHFLWQSASGRGAAAKIADRARTNILAQIYSEKSSNKEWSIMSENLQSFAPTGEEFFSVIDLKNILLGTFSSLLCGRKITPRNNLDPDARVATLATCEGGIVPVARGARGDLKTGEKIHEDEDCRPVERLIIIERAH